MGSCTRHRVSVSNDPRASLIRHFSEYIPYVSLSEIRKALQHLKNGKSPGKDGITAELLKSNGKPVFEVLQKLLNSVLSAVVLFFKKGDNEKLKTDFPSEPRLCAVSESHYESSSTQT